MIIDKPLKTINELYPWQVSLEEILSEEPDDRTIYWVHEPNGNIGKSAFCKYMCARHGAIVLGGRASDMKYGIISYKEKMGHFPHVVILDVPRVTNDYLSYAGIEEVKNGCFFSTKYECGQVLMNSPHLLIFSNEEPEHEKMSSDRWKIAKIKNNNSKLKFKKP